MANNARFKVGGATFPLTSSTAATALYDIDRPIHDCLDFLKGVLEIHLQDRFQAQVEAAGVVIDGNQDGDGYAAVVADAVPYDPIYYLGQSDYLFPLLAVYRKQSDYFEKTAAQRSTRSTWGVDFVLPPLDARQAERLGSFTIGAAKVIRNRLELGRDPNYAAGAAWMSAAGIDSIRILSSTFDPFRLKQGDRGETSLILPAVAMTLEVEERDQFLSGDYEPFEGVDGYVDLESDAGTVDDHITFNVELEQDD